MKNTMSQQATSNTPADNIIFLGFADNKVPEFKEVSSKEYILFGEDNKFPQHLLNLYNKSSNHNAIVNGKTTYIMGKGFPTNPIVNRNKETINKVFRKFCTDIELFGGGRFQCIWKMGGGLEISHIPFQCLRVAKDAKGYWYKKDWTKMDSRDDKKVFIPAFDPEDKKGVQIFAYDEYRPGCDKYPLPGYFGALNDIETDVEISIYNLSVMKNGQFSGKMVSFFNGVPTEEAKKKLEKRWEEKFNGSGNAGRTMLAFNNGTDKEPVISDLSTTDLDKLFEQLNKTVQSEIFSGHQVTSPMLFGVKEPGQLGGRSEIQDSYEIFKNTYINDKQMAIEEVQAFFAPLIGTKPEKLIPVEPLTTMVNPVDFKEILPADWVLEKLGIDKAKYLPDGGVGPLPGQPMSVNENLKNLTGRQHQQLLRVIRQVGSGKMTREAATVILKSSLALSDDEINTLLGGSNFDADISEEEYAALQFAEVGLPKDDFIVVKSFKFDSQKEFESFADLSQVDSDIVNLIGKDKRITPKIIAETLKKDPDYVAKRIRSLQEAGVLTVTTSTIGLDVIVERAINPEVIDSRPTPDTVDVYVKYSYEVKPGLGPSIIETTRPFCAKLIELNRLYTRSEIESISQRLGYSVFDRSGGWWGSKPQCRHEWKRNVVIKKRKAK